MRLRMMLHSSPMSYFQEHFVCGHCCQNDVGSLCRTNRSSRLPTDTSLELLLQTIVSLLKQRPTLIRGNASEIMAVAGKAGVVTHGVDSTADTADALASGKQLAKDYSCIVGISGANDLVSAWVCCCQQFMSAPIGGSNLKMHIKQHL